MQMYPKIYPEPNGLTLKGTYRAVLTGPDGHVKQIVEAPNVVTTNGKEFLARFLYSATTSGANTLKYVVIGSDATAEAVGNTSLGTELSRHTGTVSYTSGGIYNVVATFAAGSGTGAIATMPRA